MPLSKKNGAFHTYGIHFTDHRVQKTLISGQICVCVDFGVSQTYGIHFTDRKNTDFGSYLDL